MEYRKANFDDIDQLVLLRKKQLLDEKNTPNNGDIQTNTVNVEPDIDKEMNTLDSSFDSELRSFFSTGLTNKTIMMWVATEHNTIISTCGVCFFNYPPTFTNITGKIAYLTNIYTRNEYRNQGIASKLIEDAIKEIKLLGYKVIRLHASAQGKPLYKKFGFQDIDGFMFKELY